jgi:hypothetical protein
MHNSRKLLIVTGALLAIGSAAHAADAPAAPAMSKINWSAEPKLNLTDSRLALTSPYAQQNPVVDRHGIAVTAVDAKIGPNKTASVGYLCGLQPGPNEAGGPASAFTPEGTFLGGQFKLAFK